MQRILRAGGKSGLRRARLVPRGDGLEIVSIGRRAPWHSDLYARLLGANWVQLLGVVIFIYLNLNLLFAALYLFASGGIENARKGSFLDAFFFSVQTMATIGYGKMSPVGVVANLLVTLEALLGFVYFAVVTGLVFSKFSRPTARVMFSEQAIISPYNGAPHLMLRLANERINRIVNASVQLVLLRNENVAEGGRMRRFTDLKIVRSQVPLMQLTWTVMHPLTPESPLSARRLRACARMRRRSSSPSPGLTRPCPKPFMPAIPISRTKYCSARALRIF